MAHTGTLHSVQNKLNTRQLFTGQLKLPKAAACTNRTLHSHNSTFGKHPQLARIVLYISEALWQQPAQIAQLFNLY